MLFEMLPPSSSQISVGNVKNIERLNKPYSFGPCVTGRSYMVTHKRAQREVDIVASEFDDTPSFGTLMTSARFACSTSLWLGPDWNQIILLPVMLLVVSHTITFCS